MKNRTIKRLLAPTLLLFVALISPTYGQTWRSQLYPEDWQPLDRGGSKDAQGRFIHDFSYAGYASGEQSIPNSVGSVTIDVTQPPYAADPTGLQDATAIIQMAINDAVAQGGGTVYLPAGTYKLTTGSNMFCLRIAGSNVVLKGDGPGNTFLFVDQQDMRQKTILLASPFLQVGGNSWFENEQNVIQFSQDVNDPTVSIVLQNVNGLSVGDWIMLRADLTNAWADEHGMLSEWGGKNGTLKGISYYRQITAINASTRTVTIDVPTRYRMKTRDNARIYKLAQNHISNVGFTGFSIGQKQKSGTGFGENDYNNSNSAAYHINQAFGIAFNHVVDAWLTNVQTYRPSVNSSNFHLPSNGVMIHQSRNVTIANNRFSNPQYKGAGGNGNSFMVRGSDNLIVNNISNNSRHGFNGTDMWCSGNVYKDCELINGDKVADFHKNFTHANLVENFTGDGFEGAYRPYGSPLHGHTASQSVFWRFDYVNNRKVKSQQWGWGYVIGADATTIPEPTKGDSIKDFEEGTGFRSGLRPISLYEDQLLKRLNGGGTGNPDGGRVSDISPSDDAFVRNGQFNHENYGSLANLSVKDGSDNDYDRQSFLRFDLSGIIGDLSDAKLILHVNALSNEGNSNRPIELRQVSNDLWNEGTITWANKPVIGSLIASFIITENDLNRWVSLDVNAFVADELNSDGLVSFALIQPENQNASVVFSAKETMQAPVLKLTLATNLSTSITRNGGVNLDIDYLRATIEERESAVYWKFRAS